MIYRHQSNVAAFAGNSHRIGGLNPHSYQVTVTSVSAVVVRGNMVAEQQGYLFYAVRGMRSIILMMWG